MKWIEQFDLFLFDFDGLLVDTELLHYQAYVNALASFGHLCPLAFTDFVRLAHRGGPAWREAVLAQIPSLADFDTLYQEKKRAYLNLLKTAEIKLMPGMGELLEAVKEKKRCIVTNSPREHVEWVAKKIEILQGIPCIAREDYTKPKPDPECYALAMKRYGGRAIGFEDSLRGWTALNRAGATAVLVCGKDYPLLQEALKLGALHVESVLHFGEK